MIEKMKALTVVTVSSKKEELLSKIRDFGVMHISERKTGDSSLTQKFSKMQTVLQKLKEYDCDRKEEILNKDSFEKLDKEVSLAIESIKDITDLINKNQLKAEKIKDWGDFEPSEILSLKEEGIDLSFRTLEAKELKTMDSSINFIRLKPFGKMENIAVIGKYEIRIPGTELELPSESYSFLCNELSRLEKEKNTLEKVISDAAVYTKSYNYWMKKCSDEIIYSSVSKTAEEDEGLCILSGYIPADEEKTFKNIALANSWAYAIDDPSEGGENVPTKVKYSKVSGLMEPVFGILGTVPGYSEYDISFWFLCFFSLFFAMIIGDAGYGMIFLALGIFLRIKQKKFNNLNLLVIVVSSATVIWGAVTGTWFGLEGAMNVGLLRAMVIKPLANYPQAFGYSAIDQQNNMMKLCFMIGTIQLTLACVMNIRRKWTERNDSWIADVGWLLSINSLYYVVLLLVIGEKVNLVPFALFIVLGFVLVCIFGGMAPGLSFKQGLKAGLGDSFTNFLNTISAFGNIMSYIRLFAVGLASLAIAQSFNDMALGFNGILKVVGMVIFIIGHALNLVMGLLSVVVHGVRLNLLEFSGQLGMEWAGVAYEPFKVSEK